MAAFLAEGLLCAGSRAGTLVLGPRLIQLASRSWGRSDLRLAASEPLKQLRDSTGETVHLAVHSGGRMVYIEKLESPSAVRMASRTGASAILRAALSLPGCDAGFAPPVLRWPGQPAPGWKAPGWPQPQSQPQLRRR